MSARRPRPRARERLALAHALRTPVTTLAMGVGLLDDDRVGPLAPAQREIVQTLLDEVHRLQALLARALDTERLGTYAGPIERVGADLGEIIGRVIARLGEQAREREILLVTKIERDLHARVDPVKLPWVIASLVGNALRYSPRGSFVEVSLHARDGAAEVAVVDQGPGVASDVAAQLFDREGGRGWTLFLVREIVEAHGGEVSVEPAPGHGCRFTLRLPLAPARARPHRPRREGP